LSDIGGGGDSCNANGSGNGWEAELLAAAFEKSSGKEATEGATATRCDLERVGENSETGLSGDGCDRGDFGIGEAGD